MRKLRLPRLDLVRLTGLAKKPTETIASVVERGLPEGEF
jgi:hypothetical protein